jgi:hypothetical protein
MSISSGFIHNNHKPINYSEGRSYSSEGSKLKDIFNKAILRFRSSITTGQAKRDLNSLILDTVSQDREGIENLKATTVSNACKFADLIPSKFPNPEINIDPDGEISFEWYISPDKLLSISVGQDGRLAYAGRLGIKKISGIDYLGEQFPGELSVFIEKIY